MSSYLSKSRKAFKPKAPARRGTNTTATPSGSDQSTSIRGSVERQTQASQYPIASITTRTVDVPQAPPLPSPNLERNTIVQSNPKNALNTAAQPDTLPQHSPTLKRRGLRPQPEDFSLQSRPHTGLISSETTISNISVLCSLQKSSAGSQELATAPNSQQLRLEPSNRETSTCSGDTNGIISKAAAEKELAEKASSRFSKPLTSTLLPRGDLSIPSETASILPGHLSTQTDRTQEFATIETHTSQAQPPPNTGRKKGRPQRQKRTSQAREDNEGNREDTVMSTKRRRRAREQTPEENETVQITPSVVTMADLTKDSRLGKKSARYIKLQQKDKEEAKKSQQRLRHMDTDGIENAEDSLDFAHRSTSSDPLTPPLPAARQHLKSPVRLAPQVRLVNGQIIQDEESRLVDRHVHVGNERQSVETQVEDELTRMTNQNSYMMRERHTKWTAEQTELFFDGLRMFGTDFETISKMFPGRNRRQVKLKFGKEERHDKEYIKQVLLFERKEPSLEYFQKLSGQVYRDPSELDREMAEDKKRLEEEQERENEAMEALQRQRDREISVERERGTESAKENYADCGGEDSDKDRTSVENGQIHRGAQSATTTKQVWKQKGKGRTLAGKP